MSLVGRRNRRQVRWFPTGRQRCRCRSSFLSRVNGISCLVVGDCSLGFSLQHIGFQDRCSLVVHGYSKIRGNPMLQWLLSAKSLRWRASDYQRGKFCDTFSIISILQTGMILWVRSILRLIRLLQRLLRLRTQVRSCFSNWLVSSSFLCGDRWWFALQNWVLGSKVNRSLIFMLCHISSWLIPTVYCFLLRFNSFMSGMYVTKVQVSCLFLVCSCWKLVLLPGKSIERIYQYGC